MRTTHLKTHSALNKTENKEEPCAIPRVSVLLSLKSANTRGFSLKNTEPIRCLIPIIPALRGWNRRRAGSSRPSWLHSEFQVSVLKKKKIGQCCLWQFKVLFQYIQSLLTRQSKTMWSKTTVFNENQHWGLHSLLTRLSEDVRCFNRKSRNKRMFSVYKDEAGGRKADTGLDLQKRKKWLNWQEQGHSQAVLPVTCWGLLGEHSSGPSS